MGHIVPSGYSSISETLDQLGRELFPSTWTGEEHTARPDLIAKDEWLKTKDVIPAKGGGAPAARASLRSSNAGPVTPMPHWTGDPTAPLYQLEYAASERHRTARHELLVRLEAGHLEAAIWDRFTGTLHRAWPSTWRRHDAARMIEKGEASIPRNPNKGTLLVKRFGGAGVQVKPLTEKKMREAVMALKEKCATECLTRPQQAEFVRKHFPNNRVSVRQMGLIFQAVPKPLGRPRKFNKKV